MKTANEARRGVVGLSVVGFGAGLLSGGCGISRDVTRGTAHQASTVQICSAASCMPVHYLDDGNPDPEVIQACSDFASMLGKIVGAADAGVSATGQSTYDSNGIWFLTADQATSIDLPDAGAARTAARFGDESFQVSTTSSGVTVIGSSSRATADAAWALLHRLGYHQYFPGDLWEVVPHQNSIQVQWDFVSQAPFRMRSIWPDFGGWSNVGEEPRYPDTCDTVTDRKYQEYCANEKLRDEWSKWVERNALDHTGVVDAGHVYDQIVSTLARHVDGGLSFEHPEWRPHGPDGKFTAGTKLCTGYPELIDAVLSGYYHDQFAAKPTLQTVSVSPSDGQGWESCDDPDDRLPYTISDRAVRFANGVADGLQAEHPGVIAGLSAYFEWAPPPAHISVSPNVTVMIATSFIPAPYTFDELVSGWHDRNYDGSGPGARVGVRDYFAVNTTNHDLPNAGQGSKPALLLQHLHHYHDDLHLEHMSAESGDATGPLGMGHYLAAWAMFDPDASESVASVAANLFPGPAEQHMQDFYSVLNGGEERVSQDMLHKLYQSLSDAIGATNDPIQLKRIRTLALYVRYVELWMAFDAAAPSGKAAALQSLVRHAYRIKSTHLVHSFALYRSPPDAQEVPSNATWMVPEVDSNGQTLNPWKNNPVLTDANIDQIIQDGISNNPLATFVQKAFSDDLVPAFPPPAQGLAGRPRGNQTGTYYRYPTELHTYRAAPGPFGVTVITGQQAGTVDARNNIVPIALDLYSAAAADGATGPVLEHHTEVASHWHEDNGNPVAEALTVCLCAKSPGLHRLILQDVGGKGISLEGFPGDRWVYDSLGKSPQKQYGRWNRYFYVPKGTSVLGLYTFGMVSSYDMTIYTSQNSAACLVDVPGKCNLSNTAAGYYGFSVPGGDAGGQTPTDGQVWYTLNAANDKIFLTTPPQVAFAPDELLLPREVVEADGIGSGTLFVADPPPEDCCDSCGGTPCGADEVCRNGECLYNTCANAPACKEGNVCVVQSDGAADCVLDACASAPACKAGSMCAMQPDGTAKCVTNTCAGLVCKAGQTCSVNSDGTPVCQ